MTKGIPVSNQFKPQKVIQEDTQIVLDALPIHVTRITVDGEQALPIEGLLSTHDSGLGTYA